MKKDVGVCVADFAFKSKISVQNNASAMNPLKTIQNEFWGRFCAKAGHCRIERKRHVSVMNSIRRIKLTAQHLNAERNRRRQFCSSSAMEQMRRMQQHPNGTPRTDHGCLAPGGSGLISEPDRG